MVTIPTKDGQTITVDQSVLDRSFRKACEDGELEVVTYFLELGANKNSSDEKFGFTGCHFAARKGHIHIIEFLNKDNDMQQESFDGFLPIHIAAMENQRHVVEWYIKKGVDVNHASGKGYTPLHMAIDGCAKDVTKYLLGVQGIAVNTANAIGSYPIQYAVKKGNLDLVKLLLNHGADITIVGKGGSTLLHLAVQSKNEELVKYLVNTKKIDLEARITASGATAFMVAAEKEALNIGKFLMHHSNIHAQNRLGENAFTIACKVENLDFARMLLPCVNVNHIMSKKSNITILHLMASYGNLKAVQFLIENGADHTIQAKSGVHTITAMEVAFISNKFEVASYLKKVDLAKNAEKELLEELAKKAEKELLEENIKPKKTKKRKNKKKKNSNILQENTLDKIPDLNELQNNGEKTDIAPDSSLDQEKSLKRRISAGLSAIKRITPPTTPRKLVNHQRSSSLETLDKQDLSLNQNSSPNKDNICANTNLKNQAEKEAIVETNTEKPARDKSHKRQTSAGIVESFIKFITPPSSPDKQSPTKDISQESKDKLKMSFGQMNFDLAQEEDSVDQKNVIKITNDKPGFKKTSIFLYPNEKGLSSGIFTTDLDDGAVIPMPQMLDNIGTRLISNPFENAGYSLHVEEKEKNHKDIFHNFTRSVEKQHGPLMHTMVTDFRSHPNKKKHWEEQLGTAKVQDFWFELNSQVYARVQANHKYSLETARKEGPSGKMEYVELAEGLGPQDRRVIVHRFFKPDKDLNKDKKAIEYRA
jgi:ankyrin repeat protein